MSPRLRSLARALLLAGGLGLAAVAHAAEPAGVVLACRPDTVAANEDGFWSITVGISNLTGFGIFGDSLLLAVRPSGAAQGGSAVPQWRLVLPKGAESLSAGDSVVSDVTIGASAKSARLEVRFHAHTGTGKPITVTAAVAAAGSVLESRLPSTVAHAGGRNVEIVKVPAPADVANGAGVLLLPGEGSEAADLLVQAWRLARQGTSVVIVSGPGRGRSQGPDDFAGPLARAAALAGLDTLLRLPGVEPGRIGAWGISSGGTLALQLALERPAAFRSVAAQSASYDLWASWRAASPGGKAAIEAAAGRDSAAWRTRSPLLGASGFKPAVLVLHGERDAVFPVAPAREFAEAVKAAGGTVVARFLAQGQHVLPGAEATRFLHARLSASP